MELNKRLSKLREKNNLSIEELSLKLNVKQKKIIQWENGKKNPSLKNIYKLSKLYDVKVNSIIDEDKTIPLLIKYIKYSKVKNILIVLLIVVSISLGYIYCQKNKRREINIYTFTGESDNFKFNNGLIVLSEDNKYIEISGFEPKGKIYIKSMTVNIAFNETIWAAKEYDDDEISIRKWFEKLRFDEYYKEGVSFYNNQKSNSFATYLNKFPNDFKVEINYCTYDYCTVEILDINEVKLNTQNKIKKR